MLVSSLLTLVSISCASLGLWRIGQDVGWAGNFAFQRGILSHWQVWIGAAAGVQWTGWKLSRHARTAEADERTGTGERAVANV